MPQGTMRISKPLTNVSVQYRNTEAIFPKFLPQIPVTADSDDYWIYTRDFKLPETVRANKSAANQVTWGASTASYSAVEHALKDAISENDEDNADDVFQLQVDTTEFLTDKIIMRQEYEVAKLLFTTTTFSNNASLATATSWLGNTTSSENAPIQNVLSATTLIMRQSGVKANTGVFAVDSFNALKENTVIHERIKYVERSIVTSDLLASLFDLQAVHVGEMARDPVQEGLTTSLTTVWEAGNALIAYFSKPSRKTRSAAVGFRVMKKGNPARVKRWYDDEIEATWIEVQAKFVPRAVATLSGYLFSSVTAS